MWIGTGTLPTKVTTEGLSRSLKVSPPLGAARHALSYFTAGLCLECTGFFLLLRERLDA